MNLQPTYTAYEAVRFIKPCTKGTADRYVLNMYNDGLLPNATKINNRWAIPQSDIEEVKKKVIEGKYKLHVN